jgi:hypothetical protein
MKCSINKINFIDNNKRPIHTSSQSSSESESFCFLPLRKRKSSSILKLSENETYYGLSQHIRNLKNLTEEEITFIQTLPPENLIEIILLYDNNSKFMNEYLNDLK